MAYKILVVDDSVDIAETVKNRLKREGYEAVSAFDGEDALVKVKEEDPDIIILDLMMPKLNGFEVLREIREKHNERWRPVIIVSAKDEIESLEQCYNLEADHYLTKPCSIENILKGVKTMISLMSARIEKT